MSIPEVGGTLVWDVADNECFCCSPHNPLGLRLTFTRTAEQRWATTWTPDRWHCGVHGIVHGGFQAMVLDEIMGVVANVELRGSELMAVTGDLHIRYRKPAPVGVALTAEAWIVEGDQRRLKLAGELRAPDGTVLSDGTSRYVRLRRLPRT